MHLSIFQKSIGIIGKGFIGSNLFKDLTKKGYACQFVEKDSNWQELSFDILINANGNSSKLLPESNPMLDFDLTVRNTLKSITEIKYKKYIYISSCEVYDGLSMTENHENANIKIDKISKYGCSKYLSECLVRNRCDNHLILRLATPIGPGMKKGPMYDILKGEKLWVSGESFYQFISTSYISDFIDLALDNRINNETFNIGGIGQLTLIHVMSMIDKYVLYPLEPVIRKMVTVNKANEILKVPCCAEAIYKLKESI